MEKYYLIRHPYSEQYDASPCSEKVLRLNQSFTFVECDHFNNMPVKVTCYGKTETYRKRKIALEFFHSAVRNSEGSERDRYFTILEQLEDGAVWAKDEE